LRVGLGRGGSTRRPVISAAIKAVPELPFDYKSRRSGFALRRIRNTRAAAAKDGASTGSAAASCSVNDGKVLEGSFSQGH
jgi:hypothetical protein